MLYLGTDLPIIFNYALDTHLEFKNQVWDCQENMRPTKYLAIKKVENNRVGIELQIELQLRHSVPNS